jgi:uncharacterized protein (DUF2236 family)
MSEANQDSYFAQFALIAQMLGADPVPQARAEAEALVETMRPALSADARTKEIARLVLRQKAPAPAAAPVQTMIMGAAVDLLLPWASGLHGFVGPRITTPVARLSTAMIARTIRWAFAHEIRGGPSQT